MAQLHNSEEGIYPRDSTFYYRDICTSMFTAVQATIARIINGINQDVYQKKKEWTIKM